MAAQLDELIVVLDSEISRNSEDDTKEDLLERSRRKDLSAVMYP